MQLNLFEKSFTSYEGLVFFDLETTGFHPQGDRIIELAFVVVNPHESFRMVKQENVLIKVDRPLPAKIVSLTHITDAMLADQGIDEALMVNLIEPYLNERYAWSAYNIQFDLGFLLALLKRHAPQLSFHSDIFDVMAIYKDYHKPPHKLKDAIAAYDVVFDNTHRALDDVLATVEVFKALHHAHDVSLYLNHIGYHATYGLNGPKLSYVKYHPQPPEKESLKRAILGV
jgi:DNA polymerase III epsilon subunit-like protein